MKYLIAACVAVALLPMGAVAQDRALIEEGRLLFENETFDGNGRTCADCHDALNNFTIDRDSVRRLRGSDPFFVKGPSNKQLKDLEIEKFLRRAIILENLDGFNNLGVMRGVPHTLALRTSEARMGWSGDGSPPPGTLRSFATGAVTQHFTKTMNRTPGVDFRLPTEHELDALEAFQRSLGRQTNIDLAALTFHDDAVAHGRARFNSSPAQGGGTRGCGGCHTNGGTNNGARATGVNMLPEAPACILGFKAPGDGGFGGAILDVARRLLCDGQGPNDTVTFRGDQTFDVPPVIEAADTPPFFHNNAVETLEGAVAFYTSDTFNNSIAGAGRAFILSRDDINDIGAFLRTLNALENIRSSNVYAERSLDPDELQPTEELFALAIADTTDAIEVLTQGPLSLYPDAVQLLRQAKAALNAEDIVVAILLQEEARDQMATSN